MLPPVRGQEPERAATGAAERAKVALVEREQIPDSVSLGQNHEDYHLHVLISPAAGDDQSQSPMRLRPRPKVTTG
jgi:hypothetical protein